MCEGAGCRVRQGVTGVCAVRAVRGVCGEVQPVQPPVHARRRVTWVALKSAPMVILLVLEKVSSTKREMRHVLPTPASPTWLGLGLGLGVGVKVGVGVGVRVGLGLGLGLGC